MRKDDDRTGPRIVVGKQGAVQKKPSTGPVFMQPTQSRTLFTVSVMRARGES